MANSVLVKILGDDELSPILDRLEDKIRDGSFQASLMGKAFDAAFSVVSKAAGGFMSAFSEASNAQLDIMKAVGGLQQAIGLSYNEAETLNATITQDLAKKAAVLPGVTDDYLKLYRSISDDVATANKDLNGGTVNLEQYKEQVTDLAAKWTVLGQGMTNGQMNNALRGIMSGDSLKSLRKLEFFESNPLLVNSLESLTQQAGKELQDMTRGERLQVLLKAVDMSLTDETIARMGGTLDAQVQGFMTVLADPTTGVFGLMRDLDKQAQGQQTAFQAITEAVGTIVGPKGLLFTISDAMKEFGLEFGDPMQMLADAAKWFGKKVKSVTALIRGIGGNADRLGGLIHGLSGQLFGSMGKLLPRVVDFLSGAIVKLGQGFVFVLQHLDWNALVTGLGKAMLQINWGQVTAALGTVLAANVVLWVPTVAAAFLGPLGIAVVAGGALLASAYATHWDDVVLGFKATFNRGDNLAGELWAIVHSWWVGLNNFFLRLAIEAKYQWLLLQQTWNQWMEDLGSAVSEVFQALLTKWNDLKSATSSLIGNITSAVQGFFQGILSAFNRLRSLIPGLGGVQATSPVIKPPLDTKTSVSKPLDTQPAVIKPALDTKPVGQAAGGFLPSGGLGSLLGAVINETRQMPSGAQPMIANSSEAILNRGQQAAIAAALRGRGGGGGTFAPQILIQATPGMDIDALASEVMRQIETKFRQFESQFLD